jgi:hypothetical protein
MFLSRLGAAASGAATALLMMRVTWGASSSRQSELRKELLMQLQCSQCRRDTAQRERAFITYG